MLRESSEGLPAKWLARTHHKTLIRVDINYNFQAGSMIPAIVRDSNIAKHQCYLHTTKPKTAILNWQKLG
jgi:hypothetical protein